MSDYSFTADQILSAIKVEVEKAGSDHVYDRDLNLGGCVYVKNGEPSCLIGKALYALGVSLEELEMYDAMGGKYANALDVWEDTKAEMIASIAQRRQDDGYTWGDALRCAQREYNEQ